MEPEALSALQLGPAVLTPSRANGFLNMLEAMRKRARALSGAFLPTFPSLLVTADDIVPQGEFAVAQAQYLEPDPSQVDALVKVCGSECLNCFSREHARLVIGSGWPSHEATQVLVCPSIYIYRV